MSFDIALSRETLSIIDGILERDPGSPILPEALRRGSHVNGDVVLAWFAEYEANEEESACLLLQSLRASLLHDLKKHYPARRKTPKVPSWNWLAILKTTLLIIAGFIYFGSEGFDGIASLLLLTNMSSIPILVIGTVFALISVLVFLLVDMQMIARSMGVNFREAPKIVDVCARQLDMIKEIRKRINSNHCNADADELQRDQRILAMLHQRLQALQANGRALNARLRNHWVSAAKFVVSLLVGVVIFSGGFMAGQTLALVIATSIVSAISVTAWPIMLCSLVVGLVAFGFYWFFGREGIDIIIATFMGLNKEKLDVICDTEVMDKEHDKLNLMDGIVSKRESCLRENAALREENHVLRQRLQDIQTHLFSGADEAIVPASSSAPYPFFSDVPATSHGRIPAPPSGFHMEPDENSQGTYYGN